MHNNQYGALFLHTNTNTSLNQGKKKKTILKQRKNWMVDVYDFFKFRRIFHIQKPLN